MGLLDKIKDIGEAASGLSDLTGLGTQVYGLFNQPDPTSGINAQVSSAREMNNKSIALMRENREWQEYMSNTAHQREVADLRAAGINPIMSMGGKGAQIGSISAPHLENPHAGTAEIRSQASQKNADRLQQGGIAAAQLVNTATQLYQQKQVNEAIIAEKQAGVARTNAETLKLSRDEKLFPALQDRIQAEIANILSQSNAHASAAGLSSAMAAKTRQDTEYQHMGYQALEELLDSLGFGQGSKATMRERIKKFVSKGTSGSGPSGDFSPGDWFFQ